MEFDELSHRVIGYALEVHKQLGPGLLESTYEQCLVHELGLAHIPRQRQLAIPVAYKGVLLDCGYRIDLLIADAIVVELKCVSECCQFMKPRSSHTCDWPTSESAC